MTGHWLYHCTLIYLNTRYKKEINKKTKASWRTAWWHTDHWPTATAAQSVGFQLCFLLKIISCFHVAEAQCVESNTCVEISNQSLTNFFFTKVDEIIDLKVKGKNKEMAHNTGVISSESDSSLKSIHGFFVLQKQQVGFFMSKIAEHL